MITGNVDSLLGAEAVDRANEVLGEVQAVYVDERSDRPTWASVRVGRRDSEVLVPLDDADWDDRALHLSVAGAVVRGAPPHDDGTPTTRDQERLYTHYGIPTLRFPRSDAEVFTVDEGEVSYSVRDDVSDETVPDEGGEASQPVGEAMREAAEERPATVSGRMLAADDDVTDRSTNPR